MVTKEQAKLIAKVERERRERQRRLRASEQEMFRKRRENGYDQSRPNHLIHDSLGDPRTCTENHNHPQHIGE